MKKKGWIWLAAFVVAAGLAGSVAAQGRYSNRYSNRDVANIIRDLEQSSNAFSVDFDREMDRSRINGTRDEDRFNGYVRNYENSLDRLRRNFDRNDSWWNVRGDVQDVMARAQPVNSMMNSIAFRRNLERQWNQMRRDLNRLADTYDLPGLDGGWTGGGPNPPVGEGPRGQVPSWAVGTFYGTNPQTGGIITLFVDANGLVTINFGTSIEYATIYRQQMDHDGIRSRIQRINNGIATIRTDNGERIEYYRSYSGPTYPPTYPPIYPPTYRPGGGMQGQVPSWAVGSFWARNPQTGGRIDITISSNGNVTIDFGSGNFQYATVYRDQLNNSGVISRLERTRNGIATVRLDNGERIEYRRR